MHFAMTCSDEIIYRYADGYTWLLRYRKSDRPLVVLHSRSLPY
jgi:hypothetical protein